MANYNLTRAERETTIRWDMETNVAVIDTVDPKYVRRLKKLCEDYPETYHTVREDDVFGAFRCEVPSKFISFRKPPSKARIEAGRRSADRLRSAREART